MVTWLVPGIVFLGPRILYLDFCSIWIDPDKHTVGNCLPEETDHHMGILL